MEKICLECVLVRRHWNSEDQFHTTYMQLAKHMVEVYCLADKMVMSRHFGALSFCQPNNGPQPSSLSVEGRLVGCVELVFRIFNAL